MKIVRIALCVGLLGVGSLFGAEARKHVRLDLSQKSDAVVHDLMRLHPDITCIGHRGSSADVLATTAELEAYNRLGIPVQVLVDDADAYERSLREQNYFEDFHSYAEMLEEMRDVADTFPDISRLIDIGDGWEKTAGIADRDIWAMKISDNVALEEAQEAEVLYIACHHAREIITPEILLHFMHYLTDRYGTDPEVTYLVNNRQLWLVPMLNPDGHEYVFDVDVWWRKNRRDNNNGTFGIDLNRNYDYAWGYDNEGSSPNPASEVYRGPNPFSEPETQAIRDLTNAHSFVVSLSYHSYGNWWLYPWGYIPENTPDHDTFVEIADSCVAYNGYEPGNAASGTIYITNGDSDDWLYGEQSTKCKIFAFTPEVGTTGFHPDPSEVSGLIQENLEPNLYVARAAGEFFAPDVSFAGFSVEETSGDGDGILDPGESATLIVRLENKGIGSLSGIMAALDCNDPDITISDAESVFPDLSCSQIAGNGADPFSISVQSGAALHSVLLTLHVSASQGYAADITFRLLPGQGTVLLVADDGSAGNQGYYIEALDLLGVPYEIEDVTGTAKSIVRDRPVYSEIIWFTGAAEDNTLTDEDQTALAAFLDGGGRLLLSGNMIGYDIGTTPFYGDYLHAKFVTFMTRLHYLNAMPYNPVIPDIYVGLSQSGGNAQAFTGETDPLNPAISILNYDRGTHEGQGAIYSSGSGALAVEANAYKVVYFSFGLEGVASLQQRADMIAGVLSWFKTSGSGGGNGDVDGNGVVNVIDVVKAVNVILGIYQPGSEESARADMNGDGQINVIDVVQMVNVILGRG